MTEAKIVLSSVDQTKAAFDSAQRNLAGLHTKALAVTGALSALGITAYVATLARDIAGAVTKWDDLGKAAQRSGFQSAQGMAEYQFAARLAGVESAGLETAIGKLSTKMADAAGGNKEAAATFDALGVKYRNGNGTLRATEDVLADLADRFASYKDGPEKAALATDLFGKSGRELIPLLNGGASGLQTLREEFRKLHGEISQETVKASEQFNDNITKLEAATGALSRSLAEKMLPTLVQISEKMVEAAKNGGTLAAVWRGIVETAKVITGNDALGVATSRTSNADDQLSRVRDQINQQLQILDRDPGDTGATRRLGTLRKRLEEVQREALTATDALKRLLNPAYENDASYQGLEDRRLGADRRGAAPVPKKPAAGGGADEYTSILNRVRERLAAQTAEVTNGKELTDQQKFAIKVNDDLANAKHKLTAAQRTNIEGMLQESAAAARALETRTRQLAANKATFEQQMQEESELSAFHAEQGTKRDQYRLALTEETRALTDNGKVLDLEGRLIGATDRERTVAIEHLRIELKLRKDLEELGSNQAFDEGQRDAERQRLRDNADIAKSQVRQRVDQDAQTEFTETLRADTRGALQRAFEDSKNPAKAFIEGFASTLYTRVSGKLADAIMDAIFKTGGAGGGGAGGLLSSLMGNMGGGLQAAFSGTSLGASGFGTGMAYGNMDFGAFLHSGGIAGNESTFSRPVDPSVYRGARKYHTGGLAGDEVPAILRRGEGVFTPGQMKALGDGGSRTGGMKLTIINNGPPIGNVTDRSYSDEDRTLVIGEAVEKAVQRVSADLYDANSRVSRGLGANYKLRRGRA